MRRLIVGYSDTPDESSEVAHVRFDSNDLDAPDDYDDDDDADGGEL